MKKNGTLIPAAVLLSGCSSWSDKPIQPTLTNQNFTLKSVDGQIVPPLAGMKLGISFAQNMRVSGVMCNRFFGQGALQQGVLRVPQLASTRMMCTDPSLNQWEVLIGEMLVEGAEFQLDQQTLTLKGAGHTLVYGKR
ncbi:META domain-containing protein [Erwinia tracheiphila]